VLAISTLLTILSCFWRVISARTWTLELSFLSLWANI